MKLKGKWSGSKKEGSYIFENNAGITCQIIVDDDPFRFDAANPKQYIEVYALIGSTRVSIMEEEFYGSIREAKDYAYRYADEFLQGVLEMERKTHEN